MARDRNLFAWQAYVIVASIISLLLLVGVFFLWKTHADLLKTNAAKIEEMTKLNSEKLLADKRVARLKAMLGYNQTDDNYLSDELKADPEMQEVEKNFPTDMDVFSSSQQNKNYRQFPVTLIDTIRQRNKEVQDLKGKLGQLQAANAALVESEAKAKKVFEDEKKKAEQDLATAREEHSAAVTRLNNEKAKIQQLVDAYKKELEGKNAVLQGEVKSLRDENSKQAATIVAQSEKLKEFIKADFDEPAGRVTNVADASRKVWINIGSDDGLREGVTFVVLDESTRNVADAKKKAEMIVEKVLGPHDAMCTVTSGMTRTPVIPGDLVYSPAWRKGRVAGFALVGLMDINNDGKDDRDLIKSRILSSGGKIDAEILPSGEIKNTPGMDPNTVYVVLGADVILGEQSTKEQQERASKYAKFINESKTLGLPQISTNKLMGFLKSANDTRTIPLGGQMKGSDFEPKPENGVMRESTGQVSDLFRQRKPGGK